MATATGGRASAMAGSSSHGQFSTLQLTPTPTPTASKQLFATSNDAQDKSQMAQPSRLPSGQILDRTSANANAPARQTVQNESNSSSAGGFGTLSLVEIAANPMLEGVLGPNRDGRVRNPVPSKLKGKTDTKQGNFGVMHMGSSPGKGKEATGKEAIAAERDAAARRTSENTASRAKAAQQEKYAPARKMMNEIQKSMLGDTSNHGSPMVDQRQRARPLSPDETKIEQARLLTLLRSINPVTVVDQICKAVAYFGGIPGAPPPEDGIFPESANTRETGALFIGWLAEIFPDLSSPEVPRMLPPPQKSKGSRLSHGGPVAPEAPSPRNGFGFGQAISAPTWGLPPSLALVNSADIGQAQNTAAVVSPHMNKQPEVPTPATPVKEQSDDGGSAMSTGKRGRGRPKGSTNKGPTTNKPGKKAATKADLVAPSTTAPSGAGDISSSRPLNGTNGQNAGFGQILQSPLLQKEPEKAPQLPKPHVTYTSTPQQSALPISQRTFQQSVPRATTHQGYPENPYFTNNPKAHSDVPAPTSTISDELSPEERAVIEAFSIASKQSEVSAASSMRPSNAPPVKPPSATGVKRKRGPNKPKTVAGPSPNLSTAQPQSTQGAPLAQTMQSEQNLNSTQSNGSTSMANATFNGIANAPMQWAAPAPKISTSTNDNVGALMNPMQWATPNSNATTGTASNNPIQWQPASKTPNMAAVNSGPAPTKRQRGPRKPKAPVANGSSGTFASPSNFPSPGTFGSPSVTQSPLVVSATPPMTPSTLPNSTAGSSLLSNQQSVQQSAPVAKPPAEGLEAHYERFAAVPQQNHQTGRSQTPSITPQQQLRQQQKAPSASAQSQPQSKPQQQTQSPLVQQQQIHMQKQKSQQGIQREEQKAIQVPAAKSSSSSGFYSQRNGTGNAYGQQYASHQPSQLYAGQQASPQMSSSNSYRTSSSHTLSQTSPQFPQAENTFKTASPHTVAQPSPSYTQPLPSFTQPENNYRPGSTQGIVHPSSSYTPADTTYRTPNAQLTSYSSRPQPQTQQPSHQSQYSSYTDNTYSELPTLDSLGHSGGASAGTLGGYGQAILNNPSTSRPGTNSTNSLYASSSGLNSAFDTGTNDLLRGVSRSTGAQNTYGTSTSLGSAFDSSTNEQDMRDRMMRNYGRR